MTSICRTTAEPPNDDPRERQKFERKLLKFWAQSFLLGVPKIVVGFRSPQGLLVRIQDFETQKLPGLVSRGQASWDGEFKETESPTPRSYDCGRYTDSPNAGRMLYVLTLNPKFQATFVSISLLRSLSF